MISLQKQLLRTECREAQNSTPAITSTGFNWSALRMSLLSCIIIQILWAFSSKGQAPACEEPPAIDFGGIVSDDKLEYREGDKVQYKCNPAYSLMGTEWITCSGKTWTPAPQCLAPCSLTKQQLETKNLLLSNRRRHAQLIQSEHTLEFMCSEGYILTIPSVRKCVNGHMDLPSCISETGKNCSRPPTIENGDITTFLEKGYTSGSFVEFKCQQFYAMEGQNRSFCDNGNWTKAPLCLEPCAISVEEMENQMVELNGRPNENISQWVYLKRGDFLELRCKPGYVLATNLSQSTFMVQCNGNPIVYPECKEIVCDPPGVVNGRFRPQRNMYRDGDVLIITCNHGFHINNEQDTAECTKNGWLPPPGCSNTPCQGVPDVFNAQTEGRVKDSYEPGETVRYQCHSGFIIRGSPDVTCRAGKWTQKPVCEVSKCLPVNAPENGKILAAGVYEANQEFSFGQVVQFECNIDYKLSGSKEIHCSADGHWNAAVPTCIVITCEPPRINNGNLMTPMKVYRENERLQFICNAGYTFGERSDAECTEYGWRPKPSCKEIRCDPPIVTNGIYDPAQEVFRELEVIRVHCNQGFHFETDNREKTAECTKNGWLPIPRCILRPCDYPNIENGALTDYYELYKERAFPAQLGLSIYYRCLDGYVSEKEEDWTQISCTRGGWSPAPKCLKKCSPGHLENGRFLYSSWKTYKEGADISYVCSPHNLKTKVTCTKNGWSPTPTCTSTKICEKVEIQNGYFSESKRRFNLNGEATYGCQIGYTTPEGKVTGKTQCLQEGWTPLPKCIKTCEMPRFEHINFHTTRTVFLPDETLEYECADGYQTVNKITTGYTVCGINGWTPEPQCLAIECEMLTLSKGSVSPPKGKYDNGDVVTFSCAKGHKRVGPDSSQCYYFGWFPASPTCKEETKACGEPPSITNGNIISELHENYQHGDSVEYDCDLSFKIIGSRKIECIDGEWTSLPSCTEEEKTCGRPPHITKGRAVNIEREQYIHGDTVEYECEKNYVMVGPNKGKCLSGEWISLPSCADKSATCELPDNFENIIILQTASKRIYTHKTSIMYKCKTDGTNFIQATCKHGEWTPKIDCIERKCPPPPQLPGAIKITETRNYESGEKIAFTCLEHFEHQGVKEIMCENGKWQSPPHCVEKLCFQPPSIANGEILSLENQNLRQEQSAPVTYRNGTMLTYSCNSGFMLRGPPEIICKAGRWTTAPTCVEMPCTGVPNIINAQTESTVKHSYKPGETVRYQCHRGFTISGPSEVTCKAGKWSTQPVCEDATCSAPRNVPNADIVNDKEGRYLPGEKVQYKCREGYESMESKYVICEDGEWSQPPICKEVAGKCGPPPTTDHGDTIDFAKPVYDSGSIVQYRCKSFHAMRGSEFVHCESGQWTNPPVCLVPCTASPEEMKKNNIELKWRDTAKLYSESGDFIEFNCKWGYERDPTSSDFRIQCMEGKLAYPKCTSG
ncbi:complement factor H-like isoform X2 [Mauremys mutica]|uniref:complement factor H-like isoform X2 n=1 Tax=Mauremys mutica TaxID=74926 RepID=UPI001D163437|nr:complement factor H-like isoform X2 [Mauremys mutica]